MYEKISRRSTKKPALIRSRDVDTGSRPVTSPSSAVCTTWNDCGSGTLRKQATLWSRATKSSMYESSGRSDRAVGVVGEEHLVVAEEALHPAQPFADVRLGSGVDERDPPILDVGAEHLDAAATVGEHEVVGRPLVVAEEELLDLVRAVAEAEDEVLVPVVGVVLHEVPHDRALADVDERLGRRLGVLPQAHPHAAAEQHHLHPALSDPVPAGETVPAGHTPATGDECWGSVPP